MGVGAALVVQAVLVRLALAEAAAKEGAEAFVHVSAIAAEPEGETEIEYAAAKKMGEERVLAAFPKATVLRPSILFGKDDNFINMFAGLISTLPVLPVFGPNPNCSSSMSTMSPRRRCARSRTRESTAARSMN